MRNTYLLSLAALFMTFTTIPAEAKPQVELRCASDDSTGTTFRLRPVASRVINIDLTNPSALRDITKKRSVAQQMKKLIGGRNATTVHICLASVEDTQSVLQILSYNPTLTMGKKYSALSELELEIQQSATAEEQTTLMSSFTGVSSRLFPALGTSGVTIKVSAQPLSTAQTEAVSPPPVSAATPAAQTPVAPPRKNRGANSNTRATTPPPSYEAAASASLYPSLAGLSAL